MLKILLLSFIVISPSAYSQTTEKPDPNSQINAEEQIHGLPGGGTGRTYSVRTKKRMITAPAVVAPVSNPAPSNCSESLAGKSGTSYTACEAAQRTR